MISALLAFGAVLTLIFLRLPIALALGLVGLGGLYLTMGPVATRTIAGMTSQDSLMRYSLSVLPLFVLMGNLVAGAGISGKLFKACQMFIGQRRGGLAMATIWACGGFGAICGSSVATAATMTRVALPSMREYGYSDKLAAGTLAAGGTLGILIPPSVIIIVYAIITQSHIGKLFAGAIIPGVLGILFYLAAIRWVVARNPDAAPPASRASWPDRFRSLGAIWPVLVLFTLVLGGIYTGYFTATEAAGIGAVGALFFALTVKDLKLKAIVEIFIDSALVSSSLLLIVFGAAVFVEFINLTGVHNHLRQLVNETALSPLMIIFIIVGIYILLGCVLESISMILITVPVLFPVVMALGYDPIWFGLIVVIAAEIGLITPPIGINLFVIRSVAPDIPIGTIYRGVMPFIVADIARILLLVLFPALILWLPGVMF